MNNKFFPLVIIIVIFFTVENWLGPQLISLDITRLNQGIKVQIEEAAFYPFGKDPDVEMNNADSKEGSLSQNTINTITNSSDEQPIPLNNNKPGLFMRIIKPCPSIDYKIRILPANPSIDPGIFHNNPDQFSIIPGATEQSCNQIYQVSYHAEK